MNLSNIDMLEEKINFMIQQLTLLKEKNNTLEKENTELKSMLEERNRLIQDFENQLDQVKQQSIESTAYREREEKMKEKISNMLEKLDQLESLF